MTNRVAYSPELVQVISDKKWNNFTAGFILKDGVCSAAAPILRRALLGKTEDQCRKIIRDKGWRATVVRFSEHPSERAPSDGKPE